MAFTPAKQQNQEDSFRPASDVLVDSYQQKEAKGLEGVAVGVAKGILSTFKGAGQLGQQIANAVLPKAFEIDEYSEERLSSEESGAFGKVLRKENLEARGKAEKVGKFAEQTAEFLIPSTKLTKLEKGKNLLTKIGARALTSGGVASTQSGEIGEETAVASGAEAVIPVVGKTILKPAQNILSRIFKGFASGIGGVGQETIETLVRNPEEAIKARGIFEESLKPSTVISNLRQSGNVQSLINSVKTGTGGTLNLDGTAKELSDDFLVSVRSKNIPTGELDETAINNFIRENKDILKYGDRVKLGVFDLGNGQTSIDLNLATKNRAEALELAKRGGQQSVFDEATARATQTGPESFLQTGATGQNPKALSLDEIAEVYGKPSGETQILEKNTQEIVNGLTKVRKEASDNFEKGLEQLAETDIDTEVFKSNIEDVLNEYAVENLEFRTKTLVNRAKSIGDMISSVDTFDGKSMRTLLKNIEDMAYKTATTEERRAFNAFVQDIADGVRQSIADATPKLGQLNRQYSQDIQLANSIQKILGKVRFKNREEFVDISKRLEKLFSSSGLEERELTDFFRRAGIDEEALRTSEAVRSISTRETGKNQVGGSISEFLQAVTSGILPPERIRDLSIATGLAEPIISQILNSTNPYVKATFLEALTELSNQEQ